MQYSELKREFGKIRKMVYLPGYPEAQKEEIKCVLMPVLDSRDISEHKVGVIAEDGRMFETRIDNVDSLGRCCSKKDVKEAFKVAYDYYMRRLELKHQKIKIDYELFELDRKESDIKSTLLKTKGLITVQDLVGSLAEEFSANNLIFKVGNSWRGLQIDFREYEVSFYVEGDRVKNITFSRENEIRRWCDEDSYDFLYKMYDGNIRVISQEDYDSKDYKRLVSEQSRNNSKFYGDFKESHNFDIGDKNTLSYSHDVSYKCDIELTTDSVKTIYNALCMSVGYK